MPTPRRIFETVLYGPDLAALERFYVDVLGLEVVSRFDPRGRALRCAGSALLLFDPSHSAGASGDVPGHGARGPGHVAFLAEPGSLPAWRAHLAAHGVAIESEVTWEAGSVSLYVRDPAGNSVELAPPSLWGGLGETR